MKPSQPLALGTAALALLGAALLYLGTDRFSEEQARLPAASLPARDAAEIEAPDQMIAEETELARPAPTTPPLRTAPRVEGTQTVTGHLGFATQDLDAGGESGFEPEPARFSGRGRVRFVPAKHSAERAVIDYRLPQRAPLVFEGLPGGNWIVDVYEPGYRSCQELMFEGEDFFATLHPGTEVTLDVRLPDGTQPDHAFVTYISRDYAESTAHVPRVAARHLMSDVQPWARMGDWDIFHWTPSDPRVGVEVGEDGVPSDVLVVAEPRGDNPYDATEPCRYVSGFVRVEAGSPEPVLAQLEVTAHLSLEVHVPESLELMSEARASGVRRVVIDGVDSASFLTSVDGAWIDAPHGPAFFSHEGFDSFGQRFNGGGPELVTYLMPGTWLIGASYEDEASTTFREVDVALGWNSVALTLGQPPTDAFVPVRFECIQGFAVPNRSELEFAVIAGDPPRVTRRSLAWSHGSSGELWLARTELAEILGSVRDAQPIQVVCHFRNQRRGRLGFTSERLRLGMSALRFDEVPSGQLAAKVRGNRFNAPEHSLRARLLVPSDERARLVGLADPDALGVYVWSHNLSRGARSTVIPGRWRVALEVPSAPLMAPPSVEVEVAEGGAVTEVVFDLPESHSVRVHAPGLAPGERLRLQRSIDTPGELGASVADGPTLAEALDDRSRVEFQGVPAGHYEVCLGTAAKPLHIVVPCGEVLYEPVRADSFELRLAPLDDGSAGAFARAGFRTGDVLLAVDAREVRRLEDVDAMLDVIVRGTAIVRVRRGLQALELSLGPMPDAEDPWATFDADFVPAWR